jgi:hypothetical protein
MTWEQLFKIRAWAPLCEVAPQSEMVLPGVYKVAECVYLLTQPYDRAFERNRPEAPFVTLAIWAGSKTALNRCVNSDVGIKVQDTTKPPEALLLGTHGKYGELAELIPPTQHKIAEQAVYSKTGTFVHKIIKIGRFCFCFLDHRITNVEEPYAIEISLQ